MGQVKYKTREFTSEFLLEEVLHNTDVVVDKGSDGDSKWGTYHWIVFKFEDKLYRWDYETVPQDGIQIHDEMQECFEVLPVAKLVTKYEKVPESPIEAKPL
jgi:hypothetical protein